VVADCRANRVKCNVSERQAGDFSFISLHFGWVFMWSLMLVLFLTLYYFIVIIALCTSSYDNTTNCTQLLKYYLLVFCDYMALATVTVMSEVDVEFLSCYCVLTYCLQCFDAVG